MSKYLSNNIANITKDIRSNYTYVEDPPWRNKSNRLLKVEKYNSKYFDLTGDYSYDPDGNFTSLTRSYNSDNFTYDYYTGTNRLKKVTGLSDQYTYDYNGNMNSDINNYNYNIKYDHRNLIYEMMNTSSPNFTFLYRYKYDEAGNRTRKTIYRSDIQPPPPISENQDNPGSGWITMKDEYYSRDASGKEIAVYQSYTLDYWNVWGTGNEGRIKSTGMKYFYLKDHLGSIRAAINQNNVLVQAQDYDPWGHIARTWDSTSADYKFTGKERDQESTYDYFGARYYYSRIGRWGSPDPSQNKYPQISPYNYSFNNSLKIIDEDGKDAKIIFGKDAEGNNTIRIEIKLYYMNSSFNKSLGLDAFQLENLQALKENIQDYWSGIFNINGIDYIVSTIVNLELCNFFEKEKGSNYALNSNNQDANYWDLGFHVLGSQLLLDRGEKLKPWGDTGAHEAGHLLGLKDEEIGNGIMSRRSDINRKRAKPNDNDFNNIFDYERNSSINKSLTETQYLYSNLKYKK